MNKTEINIATKSHITNLRKLFLITGIGLATSITISNLANAQIIRISPDIDCLNRCVNNAKAKANTSGTINTECNSLSNAISGKITGKYNYTLNCTTDNGKKSFSILTPLEGIKKFSTITSSTNTEGGCRSAVERTDCKKSIIVAQCQASCDVLLDIQNLPIQQPDEIIKSVSPNVLTQKLIDTIKATSVKHLYDPNLIEAK
ncbi:MAG: hypothetical protein LBU68_00090 [Rickettsiales bacterium]|jgi:hypothetical protein|nr:hypothetical protein [Rickettsiales bacterium]